MKWNITKLFDDAKAKATEAGKSLTDFIQYMSEFCELTGRSLRNGLTFEDNFNCDQVSVNLQHDTEQIVNTDSRKKVKHILFTACNPGTYMFTSTGWRYNEQNQVAVKVKFDPAPSPTTTTVDVTLVLHYS